MNKIIILVAIALLLNGCGRVSTEVPLAVQSNVQQPQPIQVDKMTLSDKQMVSGKRLSKKVKKQLIAAHKEALKAGGNMQVICPSTVPRAVIEELKGIGVSYAVDNSVDTGYAIELSKKNDKGIQKSKGSRP